MATASVALKISLVSLLLLAVEPAWTQSTTRKPVPARQQRIVRPATPATSAAPASSSKAESVEKIVVPPSPPKPWVSNWALSLGFWNWTEELEMVNNGVSDTDVANYRADVLSVGYRRSKGRWGYDLYGLILTGKAGAAGNSTLVPYSGERSWTGFGVRVGGFFKVTNQIELGLAVPAIYRDSKWPTPTDSFVVEGEKTPLIAPMFAWRMFPTDYLMIEQSLGLVGKKGSSIWSLQAQFVF